MTTPVKTLVAKSPWKSAQQLQDWLGQLVEPNAVAARRNADEDASALNSALKKHLAVTKKLALPLTLAAAPALEAEMATLRMEKFLPEIAEGLALRTPKPATSDAAASAQIAGALHRRFPVQFTGALVAALPAALEKLRQDLVPAKAAPGAAFSAALWSDTARHRALYSRLEYVLLLWLTGVVDGASAYPPLFAGAPAAPAAVAGVGEALVRRLCEADRNCANAAVVVALVRTLGGPLLGLEGFSTSTTAQLAPEVQARLLQAFNEYFRRLTGNLTQTWAVLVKERRALAAALVKAGDVRDDRRAAFNERVTVFELVQEQGRALAELLGVPFPELGGEPEDERGPEAAITIVPAGHGEVLGAAQPGEATSQWEDAEAQAMYANLVDLGMVVPPARLGERKSALGAGAGLGGAPDDTGDDAAVAKMYFKGADPHVVQLTRYLRSVHAFRFSQDAQQGEDAGQDACSEWSDDGGGSSRAGPSARSASAAAESSDTTGQQAHALFAQLALARDAPAIDAVAAQLVTLNNSQTHRRLLRALVQSGADAGQPMPPRLVARLLATVYPWMPEVGDALVAYLLGRIGAPRRWATRRVLPLYTLRMVVQLGELVKTGMCAPERALHVLRQGARHFERASVELVCALLETCGRFLHWSPRLHAETHALLEIIRKKRLATFKHPHELRMIEAAFQRCGFGPGVQAAMRRGRGRAGVAPEKAFVRHVLATTSGNTAATHLRRLDWTSARHRQLVIRALGKPWAVGADRVSALAATAQALGVHRPAAIVAAVDAVCESVWAGLEHNAFTQNQQRLACVAYLGALFERRVVSMDTLVRVLHRILFFGHRGGDWLAQPPSPLDAPSDYFRIHLVCALLRSAFSRRRPTAALLQALTPTLRLFYLYTHVKTPPLPQDVQFALAELDDALDLSRRLPRPSTLAEATAAVRQALPRALGDSGDESDDNAVAAVAPSGSDASDGFSEHSDDSDSSESDSSLSDDSSASDESDDSDGSYNSSLSAADSTDDALSEASHSEVLTSNEEEELELFDAELAALMDRPGVPAAAGESSSSLDAVLALSTGRRGPSGPAPVERSATAAGTVPFQLAVRSGRKTRLADVAMPLDSATGARLAAHETRKAAEKERLNAIILNYVSHG